MIITFECEIIDEDEEHYMYHFLLYDLKQKNFWTRNIQ